MKLHILLLTAFLAANATSVSGSRIGGSRILNACHIDNLSDSCPDDSVVQEKLVAECEGTHGIPAAKCYMEYLCENHNQKTVDTHKECIDNVCPLAKHVPKYDCAAHAHAAAVDAAAAAAEHSDEEMTEEGEDTEAAPEEEDTNESTEATEEPPQDEEEDDPNEEVVVEETEVEVTKSPLKSSEQDEATDSGGGGMGAGHIILILLVVSIVAGATVVYREKIAYFLSGQKHEPVHLQPATNLTYG